MCATSNYMAPNDGSKSFGLSNRMDFNSTG